MKTGNVYPKGQGDMRDPYSSASFYSFCDIVSHVRLAFISMNSRERMSSQGILFWKQGQCPQGLLRSIKSGQSRPRNALTSNKVKGNLGRRRLAARQDMQRLLRKSIPAPPPHGRGKGKASTHPKLSKESFKRTSSRNLWKRKTGIFLLD